MPTKSYEKILTLLEVVSDTEKRKLLNQLRKELGDGTHAKTKVETKKIPSFEKAKKIIHSIDDGRKISIEVVAGYFDVKVQTVYNNSLVFRESGVVQVVEKTRGGKTISVAFGRNTVYSPKMLIRLKKFMFREKVTSLASVKRKIESDPSFKERISKIRYDKSLKS